MLIDLQARELWEAIKQSESIPHPRIAMPDLATLTSGSIEKWLMTWRERHLANKYRIIDFDGRKIQICQKTAYTIADVTARGIDMARAAAEILKLSNTNNEKLIELITAYLRQMQRQESIAAAVREVNTFHGALVSLLKSTALPSRSNQAYSSLCFVRDFLWQRDFAKGYCVIERLNNGRIVIRYAQLLTFQPLQLQDENNYSPWHNIEEQFWLKGLYKKFANASWFAEFVYQYQAIWATLSSTPMSRTAPNPANAVARTDIFVEADEVIVLGHHVRAAITEPIAVADERSRQPITTWNHQQLIFPQINQQLSSFMSVWGDFYRDGPIPFTLMHQTLIGDEVTFTPDQQKAQASKFVGSAIDSKQEANQHLRHFFSAYDFYYHPTRQELRRILRQDAIMPVEEGFIKVDIKLLETNHCINMWQNRARVRDNDINDSRALINQAVHLFTRIADQHISDDLNTVIAFLTSPDHSWLTPYKSRDKRVKTALTTISQSITQGEAPFNNLTSKTRKHLALSLQAAVELKCMSHETWAGSARRQITNWTCNHLRKWYFFGIGHLADIAIRFSLGCLSLLAKLPMIVPHCVHLLRHWYDRETIFLSAYEGLLAESLGMLMGGCMSALDRAGEMDEFRAALKKQFMSEGQIVSFNDTHAVKLAFYQNYGSTVTKHIQAEMATGTAGTKEAETEGIIVDSLMIKTETKEEREFFGQLAQLRDGCYDKSVSYGQYLVDRGIHQLTEKLMPTYSPAIESLITTNLMDRQLLSVTETSISSQLLQ